MNVPKLRFKEFTGEWEEKRLSNYLYVNTARNKNNIFNKNDVLSVSGEFGIVNQILFQGRSFAGESVELYHVVETGDIVYTKSPLKANPYGIIKYNSGDAGIVSTLYAVYHCKPNCSGKFVEYYFDNDLRLNKYLKPLVNIGAKHDMKISDENALSGNVILPSYDEQCKIDSFLKIIDERIEKQKDIIDTLSKQKKALMQKIFSQELRFKDDNGKEFPDWEDSLLGRICVFRRGSFPQPYGLKQWYDEANGNPFVQVVDVGENMLLKSSTKNKISKMAEPYSVFVPKGTLVITLQGSIGRIAKTQYDAFVDRTLLIITDYNVAIDIDYFKYELKNIFDCEKKKAPGGTIKTITKETLSTFGVRIPCIDEQRKIAKFVQCMEEKIKIENQVLEHWQQIKQGLLQQMFV